MKTSKDTIRNENLDLSLRVNCLSTRLKLLLLAETKERGRFPALEAATGIPSATWRTWWTRGSVPSGALVEAAAKNWPYFAYWLVTGHTDVRCGHDMPNLSAAAIGYITNWPEEMTVKATAIRNDYSREYLKTILEMDTPEEKPSVAYTVKTAALRLISQKRKQEVSANFDVQLGYEQDI